MRTIRVNKTLLFRYTLNTRRALSILILLFIINVPVSVFAWSGKCVAVTDGDTIKVMHEGKAEKIRLYGIDCPEKRQPFGQKAKQFTSDLVFGKVVEVKPVDTDRYGRTVAWVFVKGISVNCELVRAGMAWHYKKYSSDKELAEIENSAQTNKIGLWSEPNPVPPWEWRKTERLKRR